MNLQLDNNIEKLVQSCIQGDVESYHKLYNALHRQLFGFIVSRTNNREDAKDILQDVFIDLWRALPKFSYKSDKQFYSFVYTIIKRKLARYYNSNIDTVEFDDDYISENYESVNNDTILLLRLVRKLKPKYREVLELRYWSDLTFADIAKLLNTKETTVKVRHHRALKMLHVLTKE